jgi:hypothetical protein
MRELTVKEIGPQSRPTFDPETDELLDFQSQQMSALHGLMHRYNRGLDLVARRESTEDDGGRVLSGMQPIRKSAVHDLR